MSNLLGHRYLFICVKVSQAVCSGDLGVAYIRMAWERYYSTLRVLPRRLRKPAEFVVEELPTFKRLRIKSVLDLGCGAGRHCVYLAKRGFYVIGVDVSKSALRMAKEWVRKEELTNVALVRGTMTSIPLANRHIDAVISVSVIHHAVNRDIAKTITEVRRILKRNGLLLANVASVKDPRYGEGEKVENNTFKIPEAFEEKRFEELHHFFTKQEASELLTRFSKAEVEFMKNKPNYWKITAVK